MPGWTEEEVLARGRTFLDDQARERQATIERRTRDPKVPKWCTAHSQYGRSCSDCIEAKERKVAVEAKPKRKPRAHPERDIQQAAEQVLALDGWRILRMEQNYSERKRKCVGESGVPDTLAIRYNTGITPQARPQDVQVFWIEWKAPAGKLSIVQQMWHTLERKRGALTVIAGIDFPANLDGFRDWYCASGLARKL